MNKELKFIDLFCGIGGFHQALKDLGHKCVLACDIDKACREVYKKNHGIEPVNNVKDIDPEKLEDFDIICAGFPCQAFSNGGKKLCFDDSRGLLFDEIIRIAKVKKPLFMFLENVKHILKVNNSEVIKYIKQKIDETGYELQLFQLSPHEYGIPQQRERIYFVCVRKDIYKGNCSLIHEKKKPNFMNFLDNYDKLDKKYFIDGDILNCLESWDEIVKKFKKGEKISPTIMINDYYKFYNENEFNQLATWRKGYMTKNKILINKYQKEFDEFYTENNEILTKRNIYGQLDWQCGNIKENDSIFNYFIQIRQSGIRVKKAEYFPTLVAISQIPIYGKEKRYITPRECARLQGFPENFIIDSNDKNSYKQFGNSVCVENVTNVIESCLKHYNI
uniref:DNA (cytosine-5-)-methyltransferase n=1 Tax=viral metagenome TaxID=1070528 RepID=A0A6C0LDY1_9ZZZZ